MTAARQIRKHCTDGTARRWARRRACCSIIRTGRPPNGSLTLCAAEIERLERVFALYRDDSEVACLNREGRIAAPSHDLLLVLSECDRLSALSGGAFDVTVQPLWNVYARHFFGGQIPVSEGPEPRAIAAALALVDWSGD